MSQQVFDPIHEGFGTTPPVYPTGWPIKDKINIEPIKKHTATKIYKLHHAYRNRKRAGTDYGIMLDGQLVGAVTFNAWPSAGTIRGYKSKSIREVARVCVVNETPNLASCAMSKAQEAYVKKCSSNVKMLITYIHEDYEGSMFKALQGKGWEYDGYSEPHTGYSHDQKAEFGKQRWVCELDQ